MRRNTDNPGHQGMESALRVALAVTGVVALSSAAAMLFPDTLDFDRDGLLQHHQWWRLASAHLVHLNAWHALMNLAALALVMVLLHRATSLRQWFVVYVAIAVLVSIALLLAEPALQRYAGASGVIHGLIAFGALRRLGAQRLESLILLAGLVIKLGWEARFGASAASETLIGAAVITEAHLYGAICGAVVALLTPLAAGIGRRFRRA